MVGEVTSSMPVGVISPSHTVLWEPRDKDIKQYLHFDRRISKKKLTKYANDRTAVAKHAFYPLFRFTQEFTKFRKKGEVVKIKKRPIRYAARIDAAIFAKYRAELSKHYEQELVKRNLQLVPTAYRKLPIGGGRGNKSNIELARDVFDTINRLKDCTVTVVDISSFFESLDHARLKEKWELLIGGNLPPDHSAVFKAVTNYSVVDIEHAFERLKLYEKPTTGSRAVRRMREIDKLRKNNHSQICSPKDFRDKICGGDPNLPSLIQKNTLTFGIPQGTPISDLLANIYMLDFDERMNRYAEERGGIYRRYSDDIILVLSTSKVSDVLEVKDKLQIEIELESENGQLVIQDKKVAVCQFSTCDFGLKYTHIFGSASKNGLEYLGFRFDGKVVAIKDATLSNAWRKMKKRSYGSARRFVRQFRAKGRVWLIKNYAKSRLLRTMIMKVSYSQDIGYENWTFRSYVQRAAIAFSKYETVFSSQTRRYRKLAEAQIDRDLDLAIKRHFK
jgi:hypothetical protein